VKKGVPICIVDEMGMHLVRFRLRVGPVVCNFRAKLSSELFSRFLNPALLASISRLFASAISIFKCNLSLWSGFQKITRASVGVSVIATIYYTRVDSKLESFTRLLQRIVCISSRLSFDCLFSLLTTTYSREEVARQEFQQMNSSRI
jgi:hypothetical protein